MRRAGRMTRARLNLGRPAPPPFLAPLLALVLALPPVQALGEVLEVRGINYRDNASIFAMNANRLDRLWTPGSGVIARSGRER